MGPASPQSDHALRDVEARAGEIGPFVYIDNAADWSAVDSHAELQARMLLERAADLHRALHSGFRARVKNQRHSVGRDFKQTASGVASLKLLGRANDPA